MFLFLICHLYITQALSDFAVMLGGGLLLFSIFLVEMHNIYCSQIIYKEMFPVLQCFIFLHSKYCVG